jgi:hypothetical protein
VSKSLTREAGTSTSPAKMAERATHQRDEPRGRAGYGLPQGEPSERRLYSSRSSVGLQAAPSVERLEVSLARKVEYVLAG